MRDLSVIAAGSTPDESRNHNLRTQASTGAACSAISGNTFRNRHRASIGPAGFSSRDNAYLLCYKIVLALPNLLYYINYMDGAVPDGKGRDRCKF